ncbi:hypothetical protein [Amycolatopsis kentuckyensis]|uniref:hypothetical protein n=1 Tax=Amycolatopsis kentuckyensis TaxID=218823 RepID=UPI00117854E5|nr:hypothetical protein [Amycolatopsis kentuckyensis]
MTLHTASYTPNLDTHAYVSDLSAELAAGSGYSTGGVTLSSCAMTYTAANSWGTSRANSTAYAVGDVIRPASGNGFVYRCAVAGTSAGTVTTLGTVLGRETTDGTAVFENVGSGVVQLTAANATWSSPFSAGPFRYAVISDRTPGTAATQPLIGLIDFGSNQTGGGGALNVNFNSQGALLIFTP